ncbi:Rho-N domain-containing protein 1 [Hirschfeldia incana]|nr:Rho-N domain-containing protein 1 [Hirschfeldia incana]
MSGIFHLNANYVPDSRCSSNSAVFSRTPATLPCSYSCLENKLNRRLKYASGSSSFVCRASSGGYRRNPDFSRLNKHGRNKQSVNRDVFDGESSDMLSSRNGSLLSLSNSPKFQATSSPGPREKEIVELFRKVQAQLRARAAAKREDKKVEEEEDSKGQGKESETVDSLLKLLRKHSGEQSKKVNSHGDNSLPVDPVDRRQDRSSGNIVKSWTKDHNASTSFTRPASSFRRKSPVPRFESPQTYTSEATFDQASSYSVTWTHKKDTAEPHGEPEEEPQAEVEPEYEENAPEYELDPEPLTAILEPESELELNASSFYQEEGGNVTLDALSDADDEESLDDADEKEVDEAEEEPVKDLSTLKLVELRGIAKSRGLKGVSKMKKAELVELLGRHSS